MSAVPCAENPEQFHSNAPSARTKARKACAGCPARLDCLRTAINNDERWGIWGGLDPNERWKLTHKDGSWIDYLGVIRRPYGSDASLKRRKRRSRRPARRLT
ncbi:WhiB family transcriptional regulator [Streptomyces angustmyceticus]|uniref:WhiB family transcriptional regulator n=1 Tax=Streptomyces angustmyceticus TaxID=285578 RepID=UPI0036A894CA